MEFLLRRENDEILQCDSCSFPAPTAQFDWGPPFNVDHEYPKRLLCEFCRTTMASNHTRHSSPDAFSQLRAEVWRAAAGVFNMLRYGDHG